MSRTVSARIPNEMHEELRERCNKVGCTMNEWLEHAIEFCMTDHTEFDFGDDEEEEEEPEDVFPPESEPPEPKSKEIPEAKITKISYDDGKTWYDTKGNEIKKEMPKVTIRV